jgi:predicted HicB family RNase H-like nuclease
MSEHEQIARERSWRMITVRIDRDAYTEVKAAARAAGKSINRYCIDAIMAEVVGAELAGEIVPQGAAT